jgi:type I restriction enzyme M protein
MFEQAFKNIDHILRKNAGPSSELDYTEQTSWLLFLKYLHALEREKLTAVKLAGVPYTSILPETLRWETWAAPKRGDGKIDLNKALTADDLINFVNETLFPQLHKFKETAAGPNPIEYKIADIFGEVKNKFALREYNDQ